MKIFFSFLLFIIPLLFNGYGIAAIKHHFVLYGDISSKDVPLIAEKADFLVVGDISLNKIRTIKEINPNITLLKYHHALGMHKCYSEWKMINEQEDCFAHDRITGERLVAQPYGWYLMDHANEIWRSFLLQKIVRGTDDIFDGVFLDDFWIEFVNKFVSERSKKPAIAHDGLIASWDKNLIQFIKELRIAFKKKIFINGAHERYLPHVDGCMEESFVHSNQRANSFHHNPSQVFRSISKIERIKKYGKHILVQSGSNGNGPGDLERLFRYCYANYMLIASAKTSFSFQPRKTYQFSSQSPFTHCKMDLGEAKAPYQIIYSQGFEGANLVPNGNFEKGLCMWDRIAGKPSLIKSIGHPQNSVMFHGRYKGSDMIRSSFIPVQGNRLYSLSAWCSTEKNKPGSAKHKKFGLQGRFYDSKKIKLKTLCDMQFSPGTYDWQPFERNVISPEEAAFIRIRIGFVGDGTGKGWVDRVYFGPIKKRACVIGREFSNGLVLVNIGNGDASVPTSCFSIDTKTDIIHVEARGTVLLPKNDL